METFDRFTKKLAITSVITLSLLVAIPMATFAQQTDQSRKKPGVNSHKRKRPHPPHPRPVPYWYYQSEREYQEPPTVIIRLENTTKELTEKKETPAESQSTGALIIERKGNVYERIDNNSPVSKDAPEKTQKITQDVSHN